MYFCSWKISLLVRECILRDISILLLRFFLGYFLFAFLSGIIQIGGINLCVFSELCPRFSVLALGFSLMRGGSHTFCKPSIPEIPSLVVDKTLQASVLQPFAIRCFDNRYQVICFIHGYLSKISCIYLFSHLTDISFVSVSHFFGEAGPPADGVRRTAGAENPVPAQGAPSPAWKRGERAKHALLFQCDPIAVRELPTFGNLRPAGAGTAVLRHAAWNIELSNAWMNNEEYGKGKGKYKGTMSNKGK